MNQISEVPIYEKADVKITNLRAVFGAKTYAIANITSVEGQTIESNGCLLASVILMGIFFTLVGIPFILDKQSFGMFIFGVFMFALAYLIKKSQRPSYAVNLTTASGEIKAYTSFNQQSIQEIVNALNDAIIQKG